MLGAHLEGNITIKELADACALSESHFSRCFRTAFGSSVHQRLIQLRIERAKALLAQTRRPLAEVAQLSGFCDHAAFTRTFSKSERMTPSQWRKSNVEERLRGRLLEECWQQLVATSRHFPPLLEV